MVECESLRSRNKATLTVAEVGEIHGEAGLRDYLVSEFERFAEADRRLMGGALELATTLHQEDRRAREPYMNHILRVALRTVRDYEEDDPAVIIAALLHDTVEDHFRELADLEESHDVTDADAQAIAIQKLGLMFGYGVAGMVDALTIPAELKQLPKDEYRGEYRSHVISSLRANPKCRIVKVGDVDDNTGDLHQLPAKKARHIALKQLPMLPMLAELIMLDDTPLTETARMRALHRLDVRTRQLQTFVE